MGDKINKGQSKCKGCKYKSKCPVTTLPRSEANKMICPLNPGSLPSDGPKSIKFIINSRGLNFAIAYVSVMAAHCLKNSEKRLIESQKILDESNKRLHAFLKSDIPYKQHDADVKKEGLDSFSANEISYNEMLSVAFDIRTLDKDARKITAALIQSRKRGGNIQRVKYHICWFNFPVKGGYINFIHGYVNHKDKMGNFEYPFAE